MNRSEIKHVFMENILTTEERQRFEQDGFLIIPDAISPEMVTRFKECGDKIYADALQKEKAPPPL